MMDYIPIPSGSQPPIIEFNSQDEFYDQLDIHRHAIHMRTLYAIKYAYDTNFNQPITIAFLNDEDTALECSPDDWIDNLQSTLEYFIDIEDYEKCQEVKELMDKLQE